MIREAVSEDEEVDDDTGYRTMVVLAVATSIDALVVGVTMAMDGWDITSSAIMIGVVTFLLATMGVKLGAVFGDKFGSKSGILGGAILILIGLRILLEHTGVI
jgi:putative Mn2+ efflux pump MntP